MATMNVSLTSALADFVEEEVGSGAYVSASEVVRDGLRLLQRERQVAREKLAILRREVDAGLEDMRAGRYSDRTVGEIADAVLKEGSGAP
jgi:antitoxin ParD1/3/4